MTSPRGPDFIGVGAQKAGTTWLAACLAEHPQVFFAYPKELNYFNSSTDIAFLNEAKNSGKGLTWYEQQFAAARDDQIAGEFSVLYMPDPKAAEGIARAYPDVKILAALRHPIDRALSSLAHVMRLEVMHSSGRGTPLPEDPLEAGKTVPGILELGHYERQLQPYLDAFGHARIKVVLYDDIKASPHAVLRDVFGFLNIDAEFVPRALHERRNPRSVPRFEAVERLLHLGSSTLSALGLRRIVMAAKRLGLPDAIRRFNARHAQTAIDESQIARLAELYERDIAWTERLTKRSLESWRRWPA